MVYVTLHNSNGDRLTISVVVAADTGAHHNEAMTKAVALANADAFHAKYGPWIAFSSFRS